MQAAANEPISVTGAPPCLAIPLRTTSALSGSLTWAAMVMAARCCFAGANHIGVDVPALAQPTAPSIGFGSGHVFATASGPLALWFGAFAHGP